MTRINTNVTSLNAQKTLARSNAMLQESLTRLSTGLKINTGKDDPAGLIASEVLRSDIIGVERAITNSQRANQMIATADSALGQVSSLLNDIRGLISEAANTGAMSAEQISANQLQIDSSLEAIDRIAQVTQFQGRRLLDGSLDFITDGVDSDAITDLQIDQANFGTQTEVGVAVEVVRQATQAELHYQHGAIADDVVLEIGGKNGFEAFNFAGGSTIEDLANAINLVADALGVRAEVQTEATQGSMVASSYGVNNDIVITAAQAGLAAGDLRIKYTADPEGNPTPQAVYTPPSGEEPGLIEIQLETQTWEKAVYTFGAHDDVPNNAFTLTAKQAGSDYNGYTFTFASTAAASINIDVGAKTVIVDDGAAGAGTTAALKAFLDADPLFSSMFTVATSADGGSDTGFVDTGVFPPATYQTTQGVDGGAILSTANDVIDMLNSEPTLNGVITAAKAPGSDGHGIVTAFEDFAYYGSSEADNLIQFLGPTNTRNVRFVSTPGQELGIDMTTDPRVLDFSSAVFQGMIPESSFKISARQKGEEFDDVNVVINNSTTEVAVWDAQTKTLTLNVDLTGAATTLQSVINLVNNNELVSQYFRAETWGLADGTAVFADPDLDGAAVTLAGGVKSEGTLIINLETNEAGLVQTTANDLIDFFDDTASHSAAFAALGISVSNVLGSDGTGVLAATSQDLVFSTSGTDLQDANASATINAVNGEEAIFAVTAKTSGPEYDGIRIEFEDTAAVGAETVNYDPTTQTITVSINAGTTTAQMIVDIINGVNPGASDEVMELFSA
ncbi:MAG: flagellin N-terminal helical domain-containing protein, partial [Thermoguttaceae bacterium]